MGKKIDLAGQRFGKLVVVSLSDVRKGNRRGRRCQCSCGNYTEVITKSLTSGNTKSCGCGLNNPLDITGQKFGKLTAIRPTEKRINRIVVWECLCDCGTRTEVRINSLTTGNTKSCGCLKSGQTGENHPNYNPNLTEEDRLRRHYYMGGGNQISWSKQVMERDNYTCQICNQHGGKLNSHHLNGWNAFPEQRFDLDNGVTLCEDCHKEFHSQYGYGDNTREQFDEYAASKTLVLN